MKASLSSAHYAALMMPYNFVSYAKVCVGLMMASGGEVVGLKARPTIIGSSDREGAKQKHQPRLVFLVALYKKLNG
jgi:hypothetical protein